jgi:DNA-binding PadR family transcriptional regulator
MDGATRRNAGVDTHNYFRETSRVSSIRLYILDALVVEGPMHGHQLRLLAEKEHVHDWTDISVGAIYGALKRMLAEGLISEVRSEREGSYPERQIYDITDEGRVALALTKRDALQEIVVRSDPFDLAMSRLDHDKLDSLPDVLAARIERLRAMVIEADAHLRAISQYLTFTEKIVMQHKAARLAADVAWHEDLFAQLPEIIADESARKDDHHV